mgnify:CR=1 FL=1
MQEYLQNLQSDLLYNFTEFTLDISNGSTNDGSDIDANVQQAYSLLSEYSIISVQFPVITPLNIPACLNGSLKQYVSDFFSTGSTLLMVINLVEFLHL